MECRWRQNLQVEQHTRTLTLQRDNLERLLNERKSSCRAPFPGCATAPSGYIRKARRSAACRFWATLKPTTVTRNAVITTIPTILVSQELAVTSCACEETLSPIRWDNESRRMRRNDLTIARLCRAVRSANVNNLTVLKQHSLQGVFPSLSAHSLPQGKRKRGLTWLRGADNYTRCVLSSGIRNSFRLAHLVQFIVN